MKIRQKVSLKPFTTFKIGGLADYFCEAKTMQDLGAALDFASQKKLPIFVLGGGSNILISDAGWRGLVIKLTDTSMEWSGSGLVSIAAGRSWDNVVAQAVRRGLWGIENLSHIPGTAGGAVVQNIGAYGQEIKDTLVSVDVLDLKTRQQKTLSNKQCRFAYRKSIFNFEHKGRYIILGLKLKLSKKSQPNLAYKDLTVYFSGNKKPALQAIRAAVIQIRNKKYPFPRQAVGGSAGSFFKNVSLSKKEFVAFKKKFERNFGQDALAELLKSVRSSEQIKIPTAFLIDKCGFRGLANTGAQINPKQPLVILNKGKARAADVLALAKKVIKTVRQKTGLKINLEPTLVGFAK